MASAALSGVLMGLVARGDVPGLLACVALIPLLWGLSREPEPCRAGGMTLLAQLGMLLAAFEGAIPAIPWAFAAALLLSAPGAIFPGLLHALLAREVVTTLVPSYLRWWCLPFSWTAAEFVASRRWLWGEFASPVALGYTQFDSPLLSLAALSGVPAVTLAVLSVNVAVFQAVRRRRLLPLLAPALIFSIATRPGSDADPQPVPAVTAGIVQPALDPDLYLLAESVPQVGEAILDRLLTLSRRLAGAEIVVWPEGSLPLGMESRRLAEMLDSLVLGTTDLLVGTVTERGGDRFNSVAHVFSGAAEVVYDKLAPVPVGERTVTPGGNLTVGIWGGAWIAPLVCLDSLYPTFALRSARLGAEVLVVLSDDSFSRRMATPRLHLRVSAFRAVETGLPLVFASARGPSALIGPRGDVLARTEYAAVDTLKGDLPAPLRPTPYMRTGDLAGSAAVTVTAALLAMLLPGVLPARWQLSSAHAPQER